MRRAGILMPLFSLPSPYGVGAMGQAARDFVLFLEAAGQAYWQTLPLGPTSYGDSPYQSFSSRAGNPYFIDLDELAAQGLLKREEYAALDWGADPGRVDYGLLYEKRFPVLRLACGRIRERQGEEFAAFCRENDWLDDYALFMAIKGSQGGAAWSQWPRPLRLRQKQALDRARRELGEEMEFWKGVQYLFFRQWTALKAFANAHGVSVIGDLPIYVALDSADVWAQPEQFQLDRDGTPTEVAGCPPDAFGPDGQLWGNPLFDWDRMAREGYQWWIRRVEFQFRLYDVVRIDHFRGFEAYYAIPFGEKTARNGRWRPGPGSRLFRAISAELGPRAIIAEDLGFLTDGVRQMLADTGYPGMKVLEMAFGDPDEGSEYLPYRCPAHCVMYIGTHDNEPVLGWREKASPSDVRYAQRFLRLTDAEGWNWGMMRAIWASAADTAIVQLQDVLGLGSEARINTPSTLGGNWVWRTQPGALHPRLAALLREDMRTYQRLPKGAARSPQAEI